MRYIITLSTYIVLATAVAVPYATGSSSNDIINTSTITHRASNSSVPLSRSVGLYMWNYASYTIQIGVKGVVGTLAGKYAPIRLSGVVGTDGSSMTGTGFLLETPKAYPRYARFGDNRMHLGYKSLLYDYQSLRPTMGAIHPPLTAGHAEEYLRDIEVDKEIRKLPGVSNSVKEHIIETRHVALKYGLYDGVLPGDISEEDKRKAEEVYSRARLIKVARGVIVLLNQILDNMIKVAKKYGQSEYGIIEDMQSRGNVIASFLGHAVKPPSKDGIVRSFIHADGLDGEIVMWSEGLSLYMNLRLESKLPNDSRAVITGDVKLFTLNCSGRRRPLYCDPTTRGVYGIRLGRFTRFATAFY